MDDSKEAVIEMERRQPQQAESERAPETRAETIQPDHEVIQLTPEETAVRDLHVAIEDGNLNDVKSLLLENAKERIESTMTERIASAMPECDTSTEQYDILELYDTPVHKAAYKGFTEVFATLHALLNECKEKSEIMAPYGILKVFIAKHPDCVKCLCTKNRKDIKKETPLHAAVRGGCPQTLKLLLKHVDKQDVNALDSLNQTPLHLTVEAKNAVHLAKALLERKADVDGMKKELDQKRDIKSDETTDGLTSNSQASHSSFTWRTPFHRAIHHGNPELALFLLKKGASVSPQALTDAINEGYEDITRGIVESNQGYKALHYEYKHCNKSTTPFRDLIRKMPDIAEIVLDKCLDFDPENDDDNEENFNVLMNYEFVEDGSSMEQGTSENQWPEYEQIKKHPDHYKLQYGISPKNIKEHPLTLMAKYDRFKLLSHPVVESLIYLRWTRYGIWCYVLELAIHILFLLFLTLYALNVPNPLNAMITDCFSSNLTCIGISSHSRIFPSVAASMIIALAILQILLEAFQIYALKLRYFFEIQNWGHFILYPCCIIFVAMPNWTCPCVWPWQWQVGVVAVCLAWLNFIWRLAKYPHVGLYVVMFFQIINTFLKLAVLMILLLVTFGLTFYMVLSDANLPRSPFSMPILSMLKVLPMLTGEVDYDAIFRFDPSDENFTGNDLPYLPVAYIIWIPFLIVIPLLFSNLLTGVAVSDANEIIKKAKSTQRGLMVKFLLSVEITFPKILKTWLLSLYPEYFLALNPIYPIKEEERNILVWAFRWIPGWGLIKCYDRDVIRHVLIRKETLDGIEEGGVKSSTAKLQKHISENTNGLAKQVDAMKGEIQSIKVARNVTKKERNKQNQRNSRLVVMELARKNGINPDTIVAEQITD